MADHAIRIVVLLAQRPMCPACIAARTELNMRTVELYLDSIAETVQIGHLHERPCQECGKTGDTKTIGHDDDGDVHLAQTCRIAGDSSEHVGLAETLTAGASLCLDCIVSRTGIPTVQVAAARVTISRGVQLAIAIRYFAGCPTIGANVR